MKQTYNKKWLYLLLSVAAAVLIVMACKDDSTNSGDQPPEIPPISTFQMDFTAFPDTADASAKPSLLLTYNNWGFAAFNVAVWNAFITLGAAIPVAAYAAALQQTPHQQEDGTWVWAYNVGDAYSAELHGSIDANGVDWEMYISQTGGYSDFMWYSGHNNLTLTQGSWTLYQTPAEPESLLSIVWHRSTDNSTADIKYTNVEPGGDEYGGYIYYGIDPDSTFDAFYNIYNAGADQLTNIEWNLDTYDGRAKAEYRFEDTLWHCWDETLNDVSCEPTN